MKKYKEWLPVAGMVVILLILSIALFFSVRDQPDPRREPEATTVKKEDKDENTTQRKRKKTGRSDDKGCIEVYGTGYLYYLDPEDDQVFQRRLTRFLQDKGVNAETATVVEYHIDERKEEEEPAQFFLEIHDKKHTIVRVLFKKTTGTYRFDLPNPSLLDDIEEFSDEKEQEIPESTEDVIVPESRLAITDPEGQLKGIADMKKLKKELAEFLRSEDEGRRNFYVGSVTLTEKGYEAVLYFETVRQDGRNVEVSYDGKYHIRFV